MPPDTLTPTFYEENGNDNSSLDNFTTDVLVTNDVDDAITESEQDAEEEIDQLDSDSDLPPEQPPAEVPVPHPKKSSQSRSGERRRGHSLLPANRVENILQAEGLMGGNTNVSKEAVFLLSVATEEFIRHFSTLSQGHAQYFNRNMVRYDDMGGFAYPQSYRWTLNMGSSAAVVESRRDFNFLRALIPTPRPLHSAIAARNKRERDLLRDDPAMQFPQNGHEPRSKSPDPVNSESWPLQPAPCPPPKAQSKAQSQARKRLSTKAATSTPPQTTLNTSIDNLSTAQPTETWEEYKERSRRLFGPGDSSRVKQSKSSTNLSNGGPSSQTALPTRTSAKVPSPSHLGDADDPSETGSRSDTRPRSPPRPTLHQYRLPLTGPGSAFLQGPGGPFPALPSSLAPSNRHLPITGSPSSSVVPPPGRTIYSTDIVSKENAD